MGNGMKSVRAETVPPIIIVIIITIIIPFQI